jgi:hypothetical protein
LNETKLELVWKTNWMIKDMFRLSIFFVVVVGFVWGISGTNQVDPENLKFFVKLGDYGGIVFG